MDTSPVGHIAAGLMEKIAADYADSELRVGTVMLIVELEDDTQTGIVTRCSNPRDWAKLGLVEAVAADLRASLTA